MAEQEFDIPLEFRGELRRVELQDTRTNSEILVALNKYVQVTSEKNIWAYWHTGLHDMPAWCQRNVCDWVRICTGWTVRILDMVPESPNNALEYISKDLLPAAFVEGRMTGSYRGQHSKDLLATACLSQHGGAFLDVGILLLRHLDRVGWDLLAEPSSPYQVAVPLRYGQQIANHFVMSRKADPFVTRWHEIFLEVWKGRDDFEGIMDHPLLAFVHDFDFNDPRAAEFKWAVNVDINTVFAYAAQVLCFLRLTLLEGNGCDPFNGCNYWKNNIFLFDALQECFAAEKATGFDGKKLYEALSTKIDGDAGSKQHRLAYDMTWDLLRYASMMKVTRGSGLSEAPHLGKLWDQNEGEDIEQGNFAALLRYGSTHFEQTRLKVLQIEAQSPAQTFEKGVLEP